MSNLFYNRDRNVTGVVPITGISFSPKQGSTVTFSTRVYESLYPNKVKSRMGQSLNSVSAEYNLSFGLRETEAAQLLDYFESRSGTLPVSMQDASQMYHPISGFADEFSFTTIANNAFDVAAKIIVDNRSVKTNWSGLAFLNFDYHPWQAGESVEKYAIRYFEYDSSNKFNNYFYATGDHVSSVANSPFSTGSFWSRDLFFEQDVEFSNSVTPDITKIEFSNSFPLRIQDKKNIHNLEQVALKFSNITESKAKAILHFAETKFGETKFLYECPKFYKPKVFYCATWRHTWNFTSHNVELDLTEDPLGILPDNDNPAIIISQNDGWQSLRFKTYSSNGANIVSYNSENKISLSNGQTVKTWDNISRENSVSLYGSITGVCVNNQRINSIEIGTNSKVKSVTFTGNFMQSANLGGNRNLQIVDLNHNSLNELSLGGLRSLKILNVSSNRLVDLDFSDCAALTGFYGAGNILSSDQINEHLDALVNFQNYSGAYYVADAEYSDFENVAPLSGLGFSDAAILGWRGWSLKFDNAQIPIVPQNYSKPVSHFKQESITGIANGQSIFTWKDSIGGFDASRFTVSDYSRPQYIEASIGQRSVLNFNGESFLVQDDVRTLNAYGIFAVVRPENSGRLTVFSDRFNRAMLVSGNTLVSKGNLTNNFFGTLSGDSYNVIGIYSDGNSISGAVNSQTPEVQSKSSNNFFFPSSIGMTYEGTTGHSSNYPFIGKISEIIVTSGVTDFSRIMRDLGAKHGIEIV